MTDSLIGKPNVKYANKLKFNPKNSTYNYNEGFSAAKTDLSGPTSSPKFTAQFGDGKEYTAKVTDVINDVSVSFQPKFQLYMPRQDANRVVYPLVGLDAVKVYTLGASAAKDDIVLRSFQGDELRFDYNLILSSGLEPRIETDGSLGVYGPAAALLGNVTTTTDTDAKLLENARQNAKKDRIIFTVPAPFIVESGKKTTSAKAWFTLDGKTLSVHASRLKSATYPLSIDPSVYIETAAKFMRGNNESNIDFDVTNELIQKSHTTGARIDNWTGTISQAYSTWDQGTAVAGGYIYSVGGQQVYSKTYTTVGADTFVVPAGVTNVTVKMWGGGGGSAAGAASAAGGNGGGSGNATGIISVSAGETLNVYVGDGGGGGIYSAGGSDAGGGGGGHTSIIRSSTPLIIAAGGGGGGGARAALGGGGGDTTSGVTGTSVGNGHGGGGGTASAGGTAGTGGNNNGSNGGSLLGGAGADGRSSQGTDGSGASGGLPTGGAGGLANVNTTRAGAGGGGSGYYGGGGGGASSSTGTAAGGGGGGGSSYIAAGATAPSSTAGSGTTPGNSSDSVRGTAGDGATGAAALTDGTTGKSGFVLVTYSISGNSSVTTASVYWAQFNATTNAIQSPNPGNGICSGWCTNSVYDLPEARRGFSLVAYNGFLYAMGGLNDTGTRRSTVYIAKIGANGEPQLWHPSGGTPVFWYTDSGLNGATARSYFAAAAYNNRMYVLGGQTNASSGGVMTVVEADISPTGALGSWTATGMQALPSARHSHTVEIYNDTMYILGGNSSGTLQNTTYYSKINNDGTMNAWVQTENFATARSTMGSSYSTIWGAYMYMAGGCTAVNGSGYCTGIASDVQLASINADGSLSEWNTVLGLTNDRIGHSLLAWQNGLYRVGGCSSQDGTTGLCTNPSSSIDYGVINKDGEASTVANSVSSGTAPCSGASPHNCELPSVSIIGNVLSGSAIFNGYLYVWGGCSNTTSGCGTVSSGVIYTSIGSDGSLTKPASCGSWSTVDSYCYNATSLPGSVGAPGVAVFNGTIYSVGGFTAAGSVNKIYYAQPSATDGSISSWSSVILSSGAGNIGAEDVAYTYSFARANPASVGSTPGNLYILGGCTGSAGIGCSGYTGGVYKCTISTSGVPAACSQNPSGSNQQLQIGSVTDGFGHSAGTGLGAMAGTLYANYIYLIGGLSSNATYGLDLKVSRYAKIDNNNNIVAVSGSAWIESSNLTYYGRRRGSGFGYNGYLYVVGGYDGSSGGGGILADIEFAKIDVSDGSIGAWKVSTVNINQRWGLNLTVSNSYAYVIGGCITGNAPTCSSGGQTNSIQTFQVYNNDSGAIKNITAGNSLGVNRIGGSSTVMNGYIYYAGGCTDMACTTPSTATYYAPIDAYGVVGSWSSGGTLPTAVSWGKLVNAGGTLYYAGGQTGASNATAVSTIYFTSAVTSGNPTWNGTAATKGIGDTGSGAQTRTEFGVATWNDRIYVTGGFSSSGAAQSSVFSSASLAAGGNITANWTSTTGFNFARGGHTTIAYANNLYLLGGFDGTNYLNNVQYTQINGDGTVDAWTYTTSLDGPIRDADGFAANGYMYLVGGRSAATTCAPNTFIAPISANTTIATGNNPTGIGEWFETNVRYTGDRFGAAVSYSNGRLILIGGGCTSFVSSGDRMYYSTLKSQPQIAKYSRLIDTDKDVFPTYWLMNGLDNSTGAEWYMRYRSSTESAASWGQETNFGKVTLGTPETYNTLDGSGTNTNFARYYYLSVNIDSSQAFGYPEDVTRGPTIDDLTLFYTSNPSGRLHHGKTFTGGIQQPFDTPF